MKIRHINMARALFRRRIGLSLIVGLFSWSISHVVHSVDLAQEPLFLAQAAKPVMVFAMSRDHELFTKAYNDYSNLDGGMATMRDTTYRNDFSYYGYFDPDWCYSYVSGSGANYFKPMQPADNHRCLTSNASSSSSSSSSAASLGRWSGNFLNWATMTRIDILRQVLYGGKRSTDEPKTSRGGVTTPARTVLERAYLPRENHAFAKVYNPASPGNSSGNVSLYTPYDSYSEITLCNVSTSDGVPQIRVAQGAWYNWASSESAQCQWGSSATNNDNGARPYSSQINLTARVSVCEPDKDHQADRCKSYEAESYKPVGLLQREYQSISFGLFTGTWDKPRYGGVLRRSVAFPLAGNTGANAAMNEWSESTGVFTSTVGMIGNIDKFQIWGYNYSGSKYENGSSWGNPISEIYQAALGYLSGETQSKNEWSMYGGSDTGKGLTHVNQWDDPLADMAECTTCSVVIVSSGPNSWDDDHHKHETEAGRDLVTRVVPSITKAKLDSDYTNKIGSLEFGSNKNYFQGGKEFATRCTVAELSGLSALLGRCPEEPLTMGTYAVAGLAYMAKTNDIRSDVAGQQHVNTYAIELSQGLPSFDIKVGEGTISVVPVCQNTANVCSLVSVRVEDVRVENNKIVSGSYLFYWEDKDQHNGFHDYDMDAVQRLEFCVGSYCDDLVGTTGKSYRGVDNNYKNHRTKLSGHYGSVGANELLIINSTPYYNAGDRLRMTYSLSGSGSDGIKSDEIVTYEGYNDNSYNTIPPSGTNNLPSDRWRDNTNIFLKVAKYTTGSVVVNRPQSPLFYAAKYGNAKSFDANGAPVGWDLKNNNPTSEADADTPDGIPDGYFSVNNPSQLERNLQDIINQAKAEGMSGAAATTNSTSLDNGTVVYQARFNSSPWDGELRAVKLTQSGALGEQAWTTLSPDTFPANRNIITYNGTSTINFTADNWSELNATQQAALGTRTQGENIIRWMRGAADTGLRSRRKIPDSSKENLLGDIVNSSPVFAGTKSQGFENLPEVLGGGNAYRSFLTTISGRPEVVYVGSNNGMVHGFRAGNENVENQQGNTDGQEISAYVPSMIYEKLPRISSPAYGEGIAHTYLVDGLLYVGDAYVGGQWKTVLAGALGAGGKGIFALDITDPESPTVMFELTESDYPQLGNVLGQPYIAPVGDRWKLIFGNGYNSVGTGAHLFVIDLQYPKDADYSKVIPAGIGSNNGLAAPALLPGNDGAIIAAYAGDLLGNMWKFDLSGEIDSWSTAFSGQPLFMARFDGTDSNTVQPITAAPTLGRKAASVGGSDAIMVYFGTGKYLEQSDLTNRDIQTFYAIADAGVPVSPSPDAGRDSFLYQKTVVTESETSRSVNDKNEMVVDWASEKGWYLDLVPPLGGAQGERVISKPILRFDRVIFPTLIPSDASCSFGGGGWLMELAGVGDRYHGYTIIGGDGRRTENFITGLTTATGDDKVVVVSNDIAGKMDARGAGIPPEALDKGRMSWKQLR